MGGVNANRPDTAPVREEQIVLLCFQYHFDTFWNVGFVGDS